MLFYDVNILAILNMLNFKLKDINNPFQTRQSETIVDLDRYVQALKENNISFTKEQCEEAKKNLFNLNYKKSRLSYSFYVTIY